MAMDNCSISSLLLGPYGSGGQWGPSADLLAFETEALARALGASMFSNQASAADATPSSSSRSSSVFPCSPSPTASNSSAFSAGAVTPAAASAGSPFALSCSASTSSRSNPPLPHPRPQPGAVAAGRISKRKLRCSPRSSSKRDKTTYIQADPARFREMVQQMTGIGAPSAHPQREVLVMKMNEPMQTTTWPAEQVQPPPPTLDTSAGFSDAVTVQQQQPQTLSSSGLLDNSYSLFFPGLDCADELLMAVPDLLQQQQQPLQLPLPPCFPTLESWSY